MDNAEVLRQYDDMGSDYLRSQQQIRNPRNEWARCTILQLLSSLQDKVIVDGGCGDGHDTLMFLKEGASEIFAFDPSPVMLAKAQQNVQGHPVVFKEGKFEAVPFPDGCADVMIGLFSLHYVSDLDQAYREMVRVVKPGGKVAFVCTHPEDMTAHKTSPFKRQEVVEYKIYSGTVTVYIPSHNLADYLSPYFLSHFTLEKLEEYFPSNEKGEELCNPELLAFCATRKMTSAEE